MEQFPERAQSWAEASSSFLPHTPETFSVGFEPFLKTIQIKCGCPWMFRWKSFLPLRWMFGFLKCTSVPGQWWVSWLVCFLMVSYPQMFHVKSQILHFNVTKVFSGLEVFGLWGSQTEFAKFLKKNFRTFFFFFFWSRSFIDPFSCVCVCVCLNCSSCWRVFFVFFLREHTFWLKYSFFFFSNLFYWIILKQSVRITRAFFHLSIGVEKL